MPPGSPPTGLTVGPVQATDSQMALAWNALGGATSYDLQRAPDDGTGTAPNTGALSTIATAHVGTTYTDSGRSPNTRYWYRVAGRDGGGPGPYSSWVKGCTHREAPLVTVLPGPATVGWAVSLLHTNREGDVRSETMTVEWHNGAGWQGPLTSTLAGGSPSYTAWPASVPTQFRVKYNSEAAYGVGNAALGTTVGTPGGNRVLTEVAVGDPATEQVTEVWLGVGDGVNRLVWWDPIGQVTGVSASTVSDQQINITFTPPAGAVGLTGFRAYYRIGSSMGGDPSTATGSVDGASSPIAVTGLPDDTRIYFMVVAQRNGIGGVLSAEVNAWTQPAPLTATPTWSLNYPRDDDGSDNRISLFANSYPDGDNFEVYGRLGSSMGGSDPTLFTPVYDGPDLDFAGVFHTVTTGQTWYYRFRAKKTGGGGATVYSPWSAEGFATAEAELAAPGVPTIVGTTVVNAGRVDFDWAAPASGGTPSTYRVERSVNGGAFAFLQTVSHPTTIWSDTTVLAGNNYQYRVRAQNAAGNSAYATGATVCVGVQPSQLAWTATFPKKNAGSPSSAVDWSFQAPTGTWDTVRVRYRIGLAAWTEFTSASLSGTRSGLQDGQTYEFQGRAENACGQVGAYSASGNVTTDALAPTAAPTGVSATPVQAFDDRITVSWSAAPNATDHDIEWAQSVSQPASGTLISGVGNTGSYLHTGRAANTSYWYRVRSKNAAGAGPWSGWLQAYTHIEVPNLGSPATADYAAGCPALAGITVNLTHTNSGGNARAEAMTWEYRWAQSFGGVSSASWVSGGSLSAGATSFNVQASGADNDYYLQVRVRYSSETAWRTTSTVNAFCFA